MANLSTIDAGALVDRINSLWPDWIIGIGIGIGFGFGFGVMILIGSIRILKLT